MFERLLSLAARPHLYCWGPIAEFSVGLNFGIGVNIDKIGIDLRYERGFSENEATFLTDNGLSTGMLDTRPEQLILSLSLVLVLVI